LQTIVFHRLSHILGPKLDLIARLIFPEFFTLAEFSFLKHQQQLQQQQQQHQQQQEKIQKFQVGTFTAFRYFVTDNFVVFQNSQKIFWFTK